MRNMKTGKKKIFAVLCMVVMAAMVFAGCAPKHPEADIQTYCEAIVHEDQASADKMKISTEEMRKQAKKQAKKMMASMLKNSKNDAGLDKVTDGIYNLLKRMQVKTELVSKEGETATVKVTTDYVDYMGIVQQKLVPKVQKAAVAHQAELQTLSRQQQIEKLMGYVYDGLVEELDNAEVAGQQSFTVKCRINKDLNMWVPEHPEDFGQKLVANMLMPGANDDDDDDDASSASSSRRK